MAVRKSKYAVPNCAEIFVPPMKGGFPTTASNPRFSRAKTSGNSRSQWNGRNFSPSVSPLKIARRSSLTGTFAAFVESAAIRFLRAVLVVSAKNAAIKALPMSRASDRALRESSSRRIFWAVSSEKARARISARWRRAASMPFEIRPCSSVFCCFFGASRATHSTCCRVTPTSESPSRSAWSRNVNGCSFARVSSQSERRARSPRRGSCRPRRGSAGR
jgi:hypothetical protein